MASEPTLFLALGKRKCWLARPPDYSCLLERAREIFSELEEFADGEISFSFTPESIGEEVELHHSAFQFVHDKANLRIDTRKPSGLTRPNSKRSTNPLDGEQDQTMSEPCRKRIKAEQEHIDLTSPLLLTLSSLPAAAPTPAPEPVVDENDSPEQDRQISRRVLDLDVQPIPDGMVLVDNHASDSNVTGMSPINESVEAPTAPARAERVPTSGAPQGSTATQAQPIIRSLTSKNFPVDISSSTNRNCPKRQLVPEEWVGCNKPWDDNEDSGQFSVRVLTGKRF